MGYIKIKTEEEIERMRRAGRIAAEVLAEIRQEIKAGMTT
ncbi:type I methionyl aminopeptidase, partial [Candidatus Saganbacteria bacterium]|nr:type I methionyl aminopeptidase [Candidatus Saganbacteria bacterium]